VPLYNPKMSVLANIAWVQSLFMRENTWRDMMYYDVPEAWHTGPVLAEAAYPDVLVAKAVSDGRDLDCSATAWQRWK